MIHRLYNIGGIQAAARQDAVPTIMPQNKRVLITLQSGADHNVISTILYCNQALIANGYVCPVFSRGYLFSIGRQNTNRAPWVYDVSKNTSPCSLLASVRQMLSPSPVPCT